jgi:hypothetical protein
VSDRTLALDVVQKKAAAAEAKVAELARKEAEQKAAESNEKAALLRQALKLRVNRGRLNVVGSGFPFKKRDDPLSHTFHVLSEHED